MAKRAPSLEGRAVVVPGADTPAGAALAADLAAAGASVVLVGADAAALGALAADLSAGPGRALVMVGDPADADTRAALVELVAELC